MIHKIALINKSTLLSNDVAAKIANACNIQLQRDVAPAWGKLAIPVACYSSDINLGKDIARIYLFDSTDQQGALGYHTETINGVVFGKVFVKTILDYGLPVMYDSARKTQITVSSVISHEIIETFCNPYIQLWADGTVIPEGSSYAYEACDAVEANVYQVQYIIPATRGVASQTVNVTVSNFVFPEYFDTASSIGTKLDYMSVLTSPFSMSRYGYMIIRDAAGNESELFGDLYPQVLRDIKHSPV